MKLSLIVENKTYSEGIRTEHGLALLIETDEKIILFDSGESDAVINNANVMDIDLTGVDLAILSHGHYDHSGGMPLFNKIDPDAKIYIQKNAFNKSYDIDKKGKPTGNNIGIRWTDEEKKRIEPKLVFTEEPVYITDNIIISGSIPQKLRENGTERFLRESGESYVHDDMDHEQFLIIRENGKLNIFSGCSHNGVVPIIEYTNMLFPGEEIRLLFGGFHLYNSKDDHLLFDVGRITSLDVEYFMPVHCSGLNAMFRMKELLDDRCILLNAGDKLFF